jgi:hypothetical protein
MCGFIAEQPITLEAAALMLNVGYWRLYRALAALQGPIRYRRVGKHPRLHRVLTIGEVQHLREALRYRPRKPVKRLV